MKQGRGAHAEHASSGFCVVRVRANRAVTSAANALASGESRSRGALLGIARTRVRSSLFVTAGRARPRVSESGCRATCHGSGLVFGEAKRGPTGRTTSG